MDGLLNVIQRVFVQGEITEREQEAIDRLLWVTPMNEPLFNALQRLERGLVSGKISMMCHH